MDRPWALEPSPACELCVLDELFHLLGLGGLKGMTHRFWWLPGVPPVHRQLPLPQGPQPNLLSSTNCSFLSIPNPARLPWLASLSRGCGSGTCRNPLPVLSRSRQRLPKTACVLFQLHKNPAHAVRALVAPRV